MGKRITEREFSNRCWSSVSLGGGCWVWTGALTHNGYGVFYARLNGQTFWRAHRYSWTLHNGVIPDGLGICHSCDNRACVKPTHLFPATQQQNLQDASRKGRLSGENNANAKLTEEDVRAIRLSHDDPNALAAMYGVHPTHIARILNYEKWAHVKDSVDREQDRG